jgi:uncharacterized protein (DUF2235 family)
MPRNIIVCCDGTNNEFGICNTDIVRIMQIVTHSPEQQIVYYDPGVGTLPEAGVLAWLKKKRELAFATDIGDKVGTAYAHLMEVWQPGDRVFVFGFSRGAYTARMLAGMLDTLGLLQPGNSQLIPYVVEIFSSLPKNPKLFEDLSAAFRWTFSRPIAGRNDARFPVHFMGVWDTVSSVGWFSKPTKYGFTSHNPGIQVIRHAVSLDERRAFFRQNLIGEEKGQNAVELWFAGVHSDVGGGYREEDSGLWRVAFEWMVGEARRSGLLVDTDRLKNVLERTTAPQTPWAEPKHESLDWHWWWAEFIPKRVWNATTKTSQWRLNRGRPRYVRDGDRLHRSVLERLRQGGYEPRNLTQEFIASVKGLSTVPENIPYMSGKANALL